MSEKEKAETKGKANAQGPTKARALTVSSLTARILTVPEVARLKGVTCAAVYAAITQRRLPSIRVLGRIGIPESDAKSWRPVRWSGRPPGIPMSADAKQRIAASQKRRWHQRHKGKSHQE